jgi:hypothetical protein
MEREDETTEDRLKRSFKKVIRFPWTAIIFAGVVFAGAVVLGWLLTRSNIGDSAAIALRGLFVGKPVEVYRYIETVDCPVVSDVDTAERQQAGSTRGPDCLTVGSSTEFTTHAVVHPGGGAVWMSQGRHTEASGRRVVLAALPRAGVPDAYLSPRAVSSSIRWAADEFERPRSVGILFVLPHAIATDDEESKAREERLESLMPGWDVDVVSEFESRARALSTYRVIVVDHDVGVGALSGALRTTATGVVSWSPSQWEDFGVESRTVDVDSRAIVVVPKPDSALTASLYGPLPEVTEGIRDHAKVWLWTLLGAFLVILLSSAVVIHSSTGRMRKLETTAKHGRENPKTRLADALYHDLTFESLRYRLWNSAFATAAVVALATGVFAWILAFANLSEPEPVSGSLLGRDFGRFSGGMAWVATGVCLALVGRWFFAVRHLQRFRTVYRTRSDVPINGWPEHSRTESGDSAESQQAGERCDVGVCLSGGGIRSAAYGLGALQQLQNLRLWERVSHISAVSGGSYIAAAFAITNHTHGQNSDRKPFEPGSEEERHLRNHTNYLAPTLFDKLRVAGEWGGGLIANLSVVAALIWLVAGVAAIVVRSAAVAPQLSLLTSAGSPEGYIGIRGALMARDALLVSAIFILVGGLVSSLSPNGEFKAITRRFAEIFAWVAFGLLTLLVLVPAASVLWTLMMDVAAAVPLISASLAGIAVVGWLLAVLKSVLAQKQATVMAAIAGLIVPVGAIFFMSWAGWQQVKMPAETLARMFAGAAGVIIVALYVPTVRPSMFPFYRRRLRGAFAWASGKEQDVALSDLKDVTPELTICAAANYSPSPVTPPGRSAFPYAFSASVSGLETDGSDEPWMVDTKDLSRIVGEQNGTRFKQENDADSKKEKRALFEKRDGPGLEVIDAVAISGAAVSPTMGKRTMALYRALLAIFNVRLGVWVPNPLLRHLWDPAIPEGGLSKESKKVRNRFKSPPRHLPWFMKEVFGQHAPTADFTYITDGGHYDNLGLLTLLRKGCRRIICFDAGGEDIDRFTSLAQAMMLAEAELDVRLDFNPSPDLWPAVPKDGQSEDGGKKHWYSRRASAADSLPEVQKDHTVVNLTFPDEPKHGVLVYCKTTVTVDTAWSVKDYRIRNPNFPNIPTLRQLYDDERFEAYRELGAAAAPNAVLALETWEEAREQQREPPSRVEDAEPSDEGHGAATRTPKRTRRPPRWRRHLRRIRSRFARSNRDVPSRPS